jgi:hypothetical protein
MKAAERWSEHTKKLPPLVVGNHVCMQNQTGLHPTKWDKTGVIVEVLQFDQYRVQVDGTGESPFIIGNSSEITSLYRHTHLDVPLMMTSPSLPHNKPYLTKKHTARKPYHNWK